MNDLFFVITLSEVCNFADANTLYSSNNTLYSSNKELDIVFRNLEPDLNNVLVWFNVNTLKASPGKFQFIVLGTNEDDSFFLNIGKTKLNTQLKLHYWELKLTNG